MILRAVSPEPEHTRHHRGRFTHSTLVSEVLLSSVCTVGARMVRLAAPHTIEGEHDDG